MPLLTLVLAPNDDRHPSRKRKFGVTALIWGMASQNDIFFRNASCQKAFGNWLIGRIFFDIDFMIMNE